MQIEKALKNDCLCVSKVPWKFCNPTVYDFAVIYYKFAVFLKSSLLFNSFYCLFFLSTKLYDSVALNIRTAMNVKMPVFVIWVEAIIYLLLYNLHDCTFNYNKTFL